MNIIKHTYIQAERSHAKQLIAVLLTIVLTGILPTGTHAEPFPIEFKAYYKVVKGGITVGETKRSLASLSEDRFEFRSETSPRGIFNWISDAYVLEQSLWRYEDNEFRPLEYNYQNTSDDKIREVKLVFDWDKQRVTNIINGDPWHMALQPGLQDKLLFQVRMMQDLKKGATVLKYSVADGGKIKEYKIEKIGEETLKIALGQFKTIKLQRTTKTKTTIWWCAENLHYLPVKIQQQKSQGGRVVAVLHKLEGIPLPAPESKSPTGETPSP